MEGYKSGESSTDTPAGLWAFFWLWLYVFNNNVDAVDLPFSLFPSSHLPFLFFSVSLNLFLLHSPNLPLWLLVIMMIGSGPAAIWRPSSFQTELLSSFSLQLLQRAYALIVEHILHYNTARLNMLFWLAEGCSLIFKNRTPPTKRSYHRGWKYFLCVRKKKKSRQASWTERVCVCV